MGPITLSYFKTLIFSTFESLNQDIFLVIQSQLTQILIFTAFNQTHEELPAWLLFPKRLSSLVIREDRRFVCIQG